VIRLGCLGRTFHPPVGFRVDVIVERESLAAVEGSCGVRDLRAGDASSPMLEKDSEG